MNPVEYYIPQTNLHIKSYAMNNGDKIYLPLYTEDNNKYIIVPNGNVLISLHCFSESMFHEQRIRRIYEYGYYSYQDAMDMIDRYKKFGDVEITETKYEYSETIYETNAVSL